MHCVSLLHVPVLLLFLLMQFDYIDCDEHERRLYKKLLADHETLERPVGNASEAVVVKLGIVLLQILDVVHIHHEINHVLELNAWLKYGWKDANLVWDPIEYGGITDIRLPTHKIWKPDIMLYNSVAPGFDVTFGSDVVVYSSGTVSWVPPGIFKMACRIDVTYFPFDQQRCTLKFGSWTYHGFQLDVRADSDTGMDVTEYMPNGEWNLIGTRVEREEKYYECCQEPYPSLRFHMDIQRRSSYFVLYLIVPILIITCMTLFALTLPTESGEKIVIELIILLSLCYYLNLMSQISPPTSQTVPLLSLLIVCCMLVAAVSIGFTVFVLNLNSRTAETHCMSHFTHRILCDLLPPLVLMQRPHSHALGSYEKSGEELTGAKDPEENAMLLMLHKIHNQLTLAFGRVGAGNDWKFAARVVDRVCLILITITILIVIVLFAGLYLSA